MPRYRFEGWAETVLSGLSHGVNAVLHREGHGQPEGSTVVVQHGDEVTTDDPYPHALMVEVAAAKKAPAKKAAAKAPAKKAAAAKAAPAATTTDSTPAGDEPTEGQE